MTTILDRIFAGNNGLGSTIYDAFGADATVRFLAGRTKAADGRLVTLREDRRTKISVEDAPNEAQHANESDALRTSVETIRGSMKAASLGERPEPNRDLLAFQGKEYRLTKIVPVYSGEEVILYQFEAVYGA